MKRKIIFMLVITTLITVVFTCTGFAAGSATSTTPLMYKGLNNNNVLNLQKDLKSLGYYNLTPTGYFDDNTLKAVIYYQRARGLAADGIVGPITTRQIKIDKIIKTAKGYQGVPYVWGGTTPSGFDCSGFTQYVFSHNGISLARTASSQYTMGIPVSKSNLRPGDLVFFSTYKAGASHVGIYIGNNKIIHASSGENQITTSNLGISYYIQHYLGSRRIIS